MGVGEQVARKPDRFYGDPVERFTAMASSDEQGPVDRAHFRMWCRIAAEEIAYAQARR